MSATAGYLRPTNCLLSPKGRIPALALLAFLPFLQSACTSTTYSSEAPARDAVQAARERIEQAEPDRSFVTLVEADALARPIFEAIAFDAARICRTVAAADDCSKPTFKITESAEPNARTQFAPNLTPEITLSHGLVAQLADHPDGLAFLIGHEYAHLISAHVKVKRAGDGTGEEIMSTALTMLAALSQAAGNDNITYRRAAPSQAHSRAEIDAYLRDAEHARVAYRYFSLAQEHEADYLGTYLATRSGYEPTGAALVELGALRSRDPLSNLDKQDRKLPYAYWDTHTYRADRVARIRSTLDEIEALRARGFDNPLPPRLILTLQEAPNASIHTLEELIRAPR